MALIKCKECNNDVSSLAKACPHCGAPVNDEIKIYNKNENLIEIEIIKEKNNLIMNIITFIISFIMAIIYITVDGISFIKYYEETTLLDIFLNKSISMIIIFGIIALIVLISYFLKIKSRKTSIIANIGYLINTIIFISLFIIGRNNRVIFELQYFLLFGINIILFIIPRIDKLTTEKEYVKIENKNKIENHNQKLIKLYDNKNYIIKIIKLTLSIIMLIAFTTIIIINNIKLTPYEDHKKDGLSQIEIKEEILKIRKKPNLLSEVVGIVYEDDVLNVLEVVKGDNYYWYKIKINGVTGYVSNSKKDGKSLKYKNNSKTQTMEEIILEKGYTETDTNIYEYYYSNEDGTITRKIDLNENIMYQYGIINSFEAITKYEYNIQTVEYMYKMTSYGTEYYGLIEYDVKTKKHTCSSTISTWCDSSSYTAIEDMILPIIEEFDEIMQNKKYDYM